MTKESKCEGSVYFVCDSLKKVASGPHTATVHLFEHDYDAKTKFWYGVALVGCTLEEITKDARDAGVPDVPVDGECNPHSFSLTIDLDGRWGRALCLGWQDAFGPMNDDLLRIDFVCTSPLVAGSPK